MKQILKYPGAKNCIADWIINFMPKHEVYLEPFAGSLSVLLNKPPCHIETVNDLDEEIVNFFRVIRDYPEQLKRRIDLTPYSREEYEIAYEETEDEIERARRFCIRCHQGFGCGNLYKNGFKSGQQSTSPNPARAWNTLPNIITEAAVRLKTVQIENLPALELLKRYDTKDVFIYADPPYLHGTRKNYLYRYEMTDEEHMELLEALSNHPGPVMISCYDNALYDGYLKGWHKERKETLAEAGQKRVETLYMNYKSNQMTWFDYEVMT